MQPGRTWDEALPRPSFEGLCGTVLCIECGYLGLGHEHPEWCSWQVLKGRQEERQRATAAAELGERVVVALERAAEDAQRDPSSEAHSASRTRAPKARRGRRLRKSRAYGRLEG
jgi:hypothetical protein